ncbi:Bidirectional sugar transporter SWEET4 [Hibiscus syriacus]|uniref:Bidirectional sugar transporter SWEET4 n=1 Tax=Hibiscus syriacus TaxID=106335 RepID=A0A6A2ZRP0_HIBSY|nr:Bidirectional sugar transporter SWEET4 [Hibiscus syriacus]
MMWVFYGLPIVHPDSTLIITINAIGLFIETVYVTIFFIYSNKRSESMFVGILCVVFNIGMYVSPLTVMSMVIKTKSVKYMPFTLSLFNVLNGIVWMIYALLKFDINVLIPNGLGSLSGMIQLILYAWFYKNHWDDDEKATQKVQLSEI